MIAVAATLIVGILVGFLVQRSRFCSIGGFRDFFLARDTYLLKGYGGLILGAAAGFILFKMVGGNVPGFPLGMDFPPLTAFIAMVVGAIGLGFFSVLSGGCPTRQHVMAAEGKESAVFYLVGLYAGIVYFFLVTSQYVNILGS
jgi:uncharacterized protein